MLRFAYDTIAAIRCHVAATPEIEAGGLLAGGNGAVSAVAAVPNVAADPAREFKADPQLLDGLLERLDGLGLELMGTFHSHPNGPAVMSRADAALAEGTGPLLLIGTKADWWYWCMWDPDEGGEVPFAIEPPRRAEASR